MKLKLKELRHEIKQLLESSEPFNDQWFVDQLPDVIDQNYDHGFDPLLVGSKVGHGQEAVVFEYGDENVIRFEPEYENFVEDLPERWTAFHQKSKQLGALTDGRLEDTTEDGQDGGAFAFWRIMPRYEHLEDHEYQEIDDVVMNVIPVDDVINSELRKFLKKNLAADVDVSPENVMKDKNGNYVMVDI